MPKFTPELMVRKQPDVILNDSQSMSKKSSGEPSSVRDLKSQAEVPILLGPAEDDLEGSSKSLQSLELDAPRYESNRPDHGSGDADRGVCGLGAGGDGRSSEEEAHSLLLTETISRQSSGAGIQASEVVPEPIAGTSMEAAVEQLWPVEMFIPGLVVHVTCDDDASFFWSLWKRSSRRHSNHQHRAILRDRSYFQDIVVVVHQCS